MPFASEKQRKFMWWAHPTIARRWADEAKDSGQAQVDTDKSKDDSK